jgi:DNA-binding CsgD family transcriptional regulator/tetratricopeptide (TPR) repeat protein
MIGGVAQRVSSPVLVGRDAEVAQLRAALERAAAGRPATVMVAGEAGVGKTRLVAELVGQAGELGAVALTGGCLDVGEGVLTYAPLVEALRPLVGVLDRDELDRVLGGARAELARLLPELGPEAGDRPAEAPLAPTRLFELLLGVLHRLAEGGPVLLVVEDLHWADQSTRDLLGFLVRNLRAGVALVLTYRSDELHRRHPLRPFLAELDRSGRAERLELGRLGRRDLAELLAGILGEPAAPVLVGEVLARSEGNPFFAEELLAAHLDGVRLPSALRELVLARVAALSEPTQRVLEMAAVAGTRVDHQLLAAVVGQDAEELVWLLREAVTHHVLGVDEASGAYAFRHALVQEAIYDDLLPVQRGPLHAAYARALERRIEQRGHAPGRPEATAVERGQLAYHWYAAHDLGQALVASVQAGQAAESATALVEAVGHYERALELWDQAPEAAARSPLDRGAVLHRAAEAANLAGCDDHAVTLGRLALDRVDPVAEPLRAGALLERLARYHWTAADTPRAMAAVERAVAIIPPEPPSAELARALAAHGQLLMLLGRHAEARSRGQEAVAVARQVGARAVEGHALTTLGTCLGILGHLEEGIADLEQGRRIARELANVDDLGRVHANLATVLDNAGRSADAAEVFLDGVEVVRQFGALGRYGPNHLPDAANALLSLGRREEAERLLDQAFDLDLRSPGLRGRPLTVRGTLRLQTGDLRGAQADLRRVLDEAPAPLDPQNVTPVLTGLAEVALWDGRLGDARAAVADGLAAVAAAEEPYWVTQLGRTGLAVAAATAEPARARRADAEEQAARELADRLIERVRAVTSAPDVVPTPVVEANRLTVEAEWSRVTGTSDPERWAATAQAWEALGYPWPAGYARWRQAEALLDQGAPRPDAGAALARARTLAAGLGARLLTAEIDALGRRARLDLTVPADGEAPDGPAPAAATDELGLTPREREVLALVAEGRTNRQIAGTLFISDKTASVHVSNILAKLGVANRGEAAAVAHRLRRTG